MASAGGKDVVGAATDDTNKTLIAMAAVAAASVIGMGTALLYSRRQVEAANELRKQELRKQRRQYRERYRQTAEYQREKELRKEKQRQQEANL